MDDPKEVLSLCDMQKRQKVSVVKRDWQDLLLDLLILVVRKIESAKDYFAFRGVCKSWRFAAATDEDFEWTLRLPFLVQVKNERIEFSNPLAIQQQLPLPPICNTVANINEVRNCVGSNGWILVVQKNGNMNLVHIVSGAHIRLPRHERSHSHSCRGIYKMVISSSPLTSPFNCMLMIVYGHQEIAYWMPGDEIFTEIFTEVKSFLVEDLIYSCEVGYFYGLSAIGEILIISGNHEYPTKLAVRRSLIVLKACYLQCSSLSTFLVESNQNLLLVVRLGVGRFAVYNIEEEPNRRFCRVTEIKNLGNRALFVGGASASISVNACELPGCKPNRIYFTGHTQKYIDPWYEEKYHMEVYNLEDGIVEHYGCNGILSDKLCNCSCLPFWVTPSFV